MTESEFIMDQNPIYAQVNRRKSGRPNLALIAVPLAIVATGLIVFATSKPRNEPLAEATVPAARGPSLSSTTPMTNASTAPVIRAPSGVTPAAAPSRAAPAATVTTRTASVAQRRAPAPNVSVAARNASAVVAPAAPAPSVLVVEPPAPLVVAPEPIVPVEPVQ